MAISEDGKRLYVDTTDPDNPIGISLWEIMKCLGYYKRDTNGNRNLGMIIKNAQINKWAKCKPFRYVAANFASDEEREAARKEMNYGFNIPQRGFGGYSSTWTYLRPRGIVYNEFYRCGDFDGYNHAAAKPMDFIFPDGTKVYKINTLLDANLPYIRVAYRLNDSVVSPLISGADISLSDINVDGVSTGTIGDYIACVMATDSYKYFLANAKDTLNLKYGTSISDYVINLADFNIDEAAVDASSDTTNFPSEAEDKKILTLYPLINKFTPSSLGQVFSAEEYNPTSGEPTATLGGNGYATTSDNGFIGVPDGSALKIYIYKYSPIKVDYSVINYIANGTSTVISTWGFSPSSASSSTNIRSLGGTTLKYASTQVSVRMTFTLYNQGDSDVKVYVKSFSDPSGVFPKTANVSVQSGLEDGEDYILVKAGGSKAVITLATYEIGARSDYTFPSITSPAYGTLKPEIEIAYPNGEAHTPNLYGEQKEVRWR